MGAGGLNSRCKNELVKGLMTILCTLVLALHWSDHQPVVDGRCNVADGHVADGLCYRHR